VITPESLVTLFPLLLLVLSWGMTTPLAARRSRVVHFRPSDEITPRRPSRLYISCEYPPPFGFGFGWCVGVGSRDHRRGSAGAIASAGMDVCAGCACACGPVIETLLLLLLAEENRCGCEGRSRVRLLGARSGVSVSASRAWRELCMDSGVVLWLR
jgi:hypothetical protein